MRLLLGRVAVAIVVLSLLAADGVASASGVVPLGGPPVGVHQAARQSCRAITYSGSAGRIDVQTTDTSEGPRVAWGITMYDMRESVGRWDVDTYLNGQKTSSGFHRETTTPYVPHGSLLARSGQRFNIKATLLSASRRSYHSVPNQCSVP